jgi:hypothetical protein
VSVAPAFTQENGFARKATTPTDNRNPLFCPSFEAVVLEHLEIWALGRKI